MSASLAEIEPIQLPEIEPIQLRWRDYRKQIKWDLPDSSKWGYQRGRSPVVQLDGVTVFTLVLPIAQGAPETVNEGDTIFLGASGEILFEVEGESYLLRPRDVLCIAGGRPFTYRNIVLDTALMFTILANPGKSGELAEPAADQPPVIHMPWDVCRSQFHWNLPLGSEWGNHVLSGPHITTAQVRGHLVQHPVGQSRPWHATSRDVSFFHFDGVVEFNAAGKLWPLERFDIFAMRPNVPYIYNNVGLEHGLFFDIGGPAPPGGYTAYWSADPGWPIRDDAGSIELETVVGFEGERRLVRKGSQAD